MRLKVFIGSSTEGLNIARAIKEELDHDADVVVWDKVFDDYLNHSTLASLYKFRDNFDFAIFVMTPDDSIKIRGKSLVVARDNIMFELGLFIGTLGLDRCFYIYPKNVKNFHLPSDLLGNNALSYDSERYKKDHDGKQAIASACRKIRKVLGEQGIYVDRHKVTFYDSCYDAPGFQELLENSQEEFFSFGPSLQFVAQNQKDTVFRNAKEKENLKIRLMIMGNDPKAADFINEYASGSSFIPERKHSHDMFVDWQKEATAKGLNISIKVAPGIIPMSVNIVDPQLKQGQMLVIPFPYKTSGTDRACFLVKKIGNPKCMEHYTEKFNLLWDEAKDITSC